MFLYHMRNSINVQCNLSGMKNGMVRNLSPSGDSHRETLLSHDFINSPKKYKEINRLVVIEK